MNLTGGYCETSITPLSIPAMAGAYLDIEIPNCPTLVAPLVCPLPHCKFGPTIVAAERLSDSSIRCLSPPLSAGNNYWVEWACDPTGPFRTVSEAISITPTSHTPAPYGLLETQDNITIAWDPSEASRLGCQSLSIHLHLNGLLQSGQYSYTYASRYATLGTGVTPSLGLFTAPINLTDVVGSVFPVVECQMPLKAGVVRTIVLGYVWIQLLPARVVTNLVNGIVQLQCYKNYCGKYTSCDSQLDPATYERCSSGLGQKPDSPVNSVDRACCWHDLCYDERGVFNPSCDAGFVENVTKAQALCPDDDIGCFLYGGVAAKVFKKFMPLLWPINAIPRWWNKFVTAFGDPHYRTIDGCPITFNGIGDYNLLIAETDELPKVTWMGRNQPMGRGASVTSVRLANSFASVCGCSRLFF